MRIDVAMSTTRLRYSLDFTRVTACTRLDYLMVPSVPIWIDASLGAARQMSGDATRTRGLQHPGPLSCANMAFDVV